MTWLVCALLLSLLGGLVAGLLPALLKNRLWRPAALLLLCLVLMSSVAWLYKQAYWTVNFFPYVVDKLPLNHRQDTAQVVHDLKEYAINTSSVLFLIGFGVGAAVAVALLLNKINRQGSD